MVGDVENFACVHRYTLDGSKTVRRGLAPDKMIGITPLEDAWIPAAGALLARGMLDTPMSVAVHGVDPARRLRELEPIFAAMLAERAEASLCARDGKRLLGVAGLHQPGTCRRTPSPRMALALARARLRPGTAWRFGRWRRGWARRDLNEAHWHLGPVAVEPELRGQGIGTRLLDATCRCVDAANGVLYLETDTPRNVRFYQRWGFMVVCEDIVLGQPNWFMRRPISGQP